MDIGQRTLFLTMSCQCGEGEHHLEKDIMDDADLFRMLCLLSILSDSVVDLTIGMRGQPDGHPHADNTSPFRAPITSKSISTTTITSDHHDAHDIL